MTARSTLSASELYSRLLSYVRPYWLAFVISLACMAASALIEPLFPAMMKQLLDGGFSGAHGEWDWILYPAAIMMIFLARAVFGFVGDYVLSWVSNHVVMEIRRQMFERILLLPVRYFSEHLSGRLLSRVTYDVNGVTAAATEAITTLVKDTLSIVGLLGWMLYLNWKLTLITLTIVPFVAWSMRIFSRRLRMVARGGQEAQGTITQILQEGIEGHKVIKIFGGQNYENKRFIKALQDQRRFAMRAKVASATQGPIVQFFAATALAVIVGIALHQASNQETSVGSFVSFITAMLMMLAPLKRLTDVNAPIQQGIAAAESVFGILDEPVEKNSGKHGMQRAYGEVRFENVSFTYPNSNTAAVNNVSFSIKPGECVALVGQSGSGKSTIANLLPRFYEAEGSIRIDGQPVADIDIVNLRANISLVSQDVVLFNDSVTANIAYGAYHDADTQAIRAAASASHALEFIEAMPQGFDTLVGEHGVKLSGGQRQRLAIARALLKDAPILILDEATSALDNESERHVQLALDHLMRGRTTLVIAHRLSTIERSDRILVLAQGKIVESGRHDDLLSANGVYTRLYRLHQATETS